MKFTDDEIIRQDHVDNSIWNLINDLIPDEYRVEPKTNTYSDKQIPYEGEFVGRIRYLVQAYIAAKLNIVDNAADLDDFDYAFYPFITSGFRQMQKRGLDI